MSVRVCSEPVAWRQMQTAACLRLQLPAETAHCAVSKGITLFQNNIKRSDALNSDEPNTLTTSESPLTSTF